MPIPGIKQVAAKAGVSIATVSHVMNKTRTVRDETRNRVLSAVKDLGYTQNAAARRLATGRSEIVGLLIADVRNPFFPEISTSFQEEALVREVDTVVMNTNHDPHRTLSCIRRLLALNVPGISILTTQIDPAVKEMLVERGVCAVYLDTGEPGPYVSNVKLDYQRGLSETVEHLTSLGHRRVAYISGPARFIFSQRRKQAFLDVAADGSITPQVIESDLTVQGGYFACSKLLRPGGPTAIICSNDQMAIGALHYAHDRAVRVPEDVSLVGFDNIAFSEYTQPALTTISVPRDCIGRIAFEALWEIVADENHAGKEELVPTSLIVRQSTAAAQK